jgi:cell shape-determining protein MreC
MKRTFLAKRNALLSPHGISWGVFALLFALFVLLVRLIAPNIFLQAVTPVFRVSEALGAGTHTFFSSFGNAAALTARNENLAGENTVLASENQALLEKVTNLSELLGTSAAQKNIPGILAGVVARPPVSPYDTLVLDAGKSDGVALGMEAFGAGGVPVGVVSQVLSDFSRVTLFSAPGTVTNGSVGHANTVLTITGAGGGAMNAIVARAATVAEGDTVFAPGPGMLPIGTVVRVESSALSPGVTLRIRPAVNIFSISWVTLRATGIVPSTLATSTAL